MMPNRKAPELFSYSTEEGRNIIVQDSLFSGANQTHQEMDINKMFWELQKLLEKDTKLHLHAITLSDYWREGRIPRGLRIKKFPSSGFGNDDFRQKWEAILNKCSSDLMLLIIEEAKKQKELLQADIAEIKSKIAASQEDHMKTSLEEKLSKDMEALTKKLKELKLKKYKRDEKDYDDGMVYTWNTRQRQRKQRTVSFNFPNEEEEDNQTYGAVGTSQSFLDYIAEPQEPRQKGRRKQGGAKGNQGYTPRSILRSNKNPR